MPEYDAFGREIGEDTLAGWRSGSSGLPESPAPEPAAPPRPVPAPVTSGDPLATTAASATPVAAPPASATPASPAPTASPPPSARPARLQFQRPPRRKRRIRFRWIALLIAGWVGFNVVSNVADKVDEAARSIKIPAITVPTPAAAAPVGLGARSLLRPAAFERALADLRGREIGRIQNLRVAPERIDASLLTRRGTLVSVQIRPGGEFQRFSESGAGFGGIATIPYGKLDPTAPQQLVRAAAERLGRPVSRIDYLVPTLSSGELTWGAYFKGGAIFLANARGKITRRIS